MTRKRTNVYIDGFNLYYRVLKGTPYKWLNLKKLCEALLPASHHELHHIKYFTAKVSDRPNDPGLAARQDTYLKALSTIPNLHIIQGHFLSSTPIMAIDDCGTEQKIHVFTPKEISPVLLPIARQVKGKLQYIRVKKTEEKGSDVNLAVHLLSDGYKKDYDVGVLITNDSDLLTPIKIIKQELKLPVGVVIPGIKNQSRELNRWASFTKTITSEHLRVSQFPDEIIDIVGRKIRKPKEW